MRGANLHERALGITDQNPVRNLEGHHPLRWLADCGEDASGLTMPTFLLSLGTGHSVSSVLELRRILELG